MLYHFSLVKVTPDEEEFLFAGSFPDSDDDFIFLREKIGITRIINLTGATKYRSPHAGRFSITCIPVRDFQPPTIAQVKEYVDTLKKAQKEKERVYTHCHAGVGRTGTMLACWFVANNPGIDGDSAVAHIREIRSPFPCIETKSQEHVVRQYARLIA